MLIRFFNTIARGSFRCRTENLVERRQKPLDGVEFGRRDRNVRRQVVDHRQHAAASVFVLCSI